MLAHSSLQLALRTRALTASVVTTGTMSLAATTAGYTRADGESFLDDGFYAGMEVTPSGFADNTPRVVSDVAASLLTIEDGLTAETASGSRALTVGFPAFRAWENVKRPSVAARRWFIEENYEPLNTKNLGVTSGGTIEDRGLWILKFFGIANTDMMALSLMADAVNALFPPGYTINANAYVDGDVVNRRSRLLVLDDGRPFISVTIPWRAHTPNS